MNNREFKEKVKVITVKEWIKGKVKGSEHASIYSLGIYNIPIKEIQEEFGIQEEQLKGFLLNPDNSYKLAKYAYEKREFTISTRDSSGRRKTAYNYEENPRNSGYGNYYDYAIRDQEK